MGKRKVKNINYKDLNQLSISMVAQDWGLDLVRVRSGVFNIKCPSKKHPGADTHLGNCVLTDNGRINSYHCFTCDAKGGPLNLVMDIEGCNIQTAAELLAAKYGLVSETYIDESKLVRWGGLTQEEYKELGLCNTSIEIPYGVDEHGNVLSNFEGYSLRDLAREDPELHDTMLIGKFAEKIDGLAKYLSLLKADYFLEYGLDFVYSMEWEDICFKLAERYKSLLMKGLMDKDRYYEVCNIEDDELTKKIKSKVLRALLENIKKNHSANAS